MQRALVTCLAALLLCGGILIDHSSPFGAGAARAQDVDLDAIFRCTAKDAPGKSQCAQARDLILNNCTSCHSFAPIVMQQFDANGWESLIFRHSNGGRLPNMSKDQIKTVQNYLTANFNASLPVPPLPKELLDTWTNY